MSNIETSVHANVKRLKESWGLGEWTNEPDIKQWLDQDTQFLCLIIRNHWGVWLGYVGIKKEHPFFQKGYDHVDIDLEVHGGLTFSGEFQLDYEEFEGMCNKFDKKEKVWWLGFDCGHGGDLMPRHYKKNDFNFNHRYETYRNIDYVTNEVQSLVKQLKAVKDE